MEICHQKVNVVLRRNSRIARVCKDKHHIGSDHGHGRGGTLPQSVNSVKWSQTFQATKRKEFVWLTLEGLLLNKFACRDALGLKQTTLQRYHVSSFWCFRTQVGSIAIKNVSFKSDAFLTLSKHQHSRQWHTSRIKFDILFVCILLLSPAHGSQGLIQTISWKLGFHGCDETGLKWVN